MSPEEKFVHELQRSQWLSAAEISARQRPLIERLVRHAAAQTDFYPERLNPLFSGDPASAAVDLSRWDEIPILTRAEIAARSADLIARTLPVESGSSVVRRSSGTTTQPLEFRRSALARRVASCQLHRLYELHDFDFSGVFAHITHDAAGNSSYPQGLRSKGWNFVNRDADVLTLEIRTPAADQLEWLERVHPDYVMTYANNLRAVAETALARGGSSCRFKFFIATGEALDDAAHDLIVRAFGCQVTDVYGAREIGPIAFRCPDGQTYHFCDETVRCELLDDGCRPVSAGEYGRVVVTPLYEYAMPFIRYDLGDYAKLSTAPCSCGRGLVSLEAIAGRSRNLFVMPDGSKYWPPLGPISKSLTKFLSYRQIQFVQTHVDMLEIKYVPEQLGVKPDLAEITELLRAEFHPRLNVLLVPVERIERGAGMKLEQFISLVAV